MLGKNCNPCKTVSGCVAASSPGFGEFATNKECDDVCNSKNFQGTGARPDMRLLPLKSAELDPKDVRITVELAHKLRRAQWPWATFTPPKPTVSRNANPPLANRAEEQLPAS